MDVCLVNMPMADVERPSIALGLLKAILARDGIRSKVFYGNLWFLDYFGPGAYRLARASTPEEALMDWVFAPAAFPEHQTDEDQYLDLLLQRNLILAKNDTDAVRINLRKLRAEAPAFIDWAAATVLQENPRVVGCTSMFQQHVASLALLRKIKELAPSVATIIGGANCETIMGRTTHENFRWVDYVVSGEADSYITDLCRILLEKGVEAEASELPEGVLAPIHRRIGYPVVDKGDGVPRSSTKSMAGMPAPDYDDYYDELSGALYGSHIIPGTPIETSRGCWWGEKNHCTFCGLNGVGMDYRVKKPADVMTELAFLEKRYRTKHFESVDNILDMKYFETLLPQLADSDRDYSIFFETKANLKRRHVELMRRAGIKWIQPGIESLHTQVLKLIKKGASSWTNVLLLKWCRQYGIRVGWNMIVGFPGEEDAWYVDMAPWLPALEHLQPGQLIGLRYDRYSPYFNQAKAYNLNLRPGGFYRFAYPLPPQTLSNQVYFFEEPSQSLPPYFHLREHGVPNRPGLEAVRKALDAWEEAWKSDLPNLSVAECDGGYEIHDTRACAPAEVYRIPVAHKRLLELCDETASMDQIVTGGERMSHMSVAEVERGLAELIERKLVVELDGRFLSLVLIEPVTPLATAMEFPGGHFSMKPIPAQFRPSLSPLISA
jgi:ribosomal peptide maturation radical SAM protein 1